MKKILFINWCMLIAINRIDNNQQYNKLYVASAYERWQAVTTTKPTNAVNFLHKTEPKRQLCLLAWGSEGINHKSMFQFQVYQRLLFLVYNGKDNKFNYFSTGSYLAILYN